MPVSFFLFFFFNDTATTEIYTLSLHDALPISLPKGVARVGCTAEILDVVKRYEDGRMDILTAGRAPFRVVELVTEDPLLEGHVDYLEDRETPANPRVQRELVELFEACHTLIFDDYPKNLQGASPEDLSYLVAATLPMDLLWKQQILELRSEADRQERLVAYLRERSEEHTSELQSRLHLACRLLLE